MKETSKLNFILLFMVHEINIKVKKFALVLMNIIFYNLGVCSCTKPHDFSDYAESSSLLLKEGTLFCSLKSSAVKY